MLCATGRRITDDADTRQTWHYRLEELDEPLSDQVWQVEEHSSDIAAA
jgi:hypothetical protein